MTARALTLYGGGSGWDAEDFALMLALAVLMRLMVG
jgi:hypothetical protein